MDRKTKLILGIMLFSLAIALNIHVLKKRAMYRDMAKTMLMQANMFEEKYMKGIDCSKPVTMYVVEKGNILIQYQIPNAPQGNFYGRFGSTPDELGISDMGYDPVEKAKVKKMLIVYLAIKDTESLLSYAASIKDDWSTTENEKRTGGKVQIFTTCKECFERID